MIETQAELVKWISQFSSDKFFKLGVDLEADNRHHYKEQLCLIQISDGREAWMIDALKLKDLSALKEIMARSEFWMHGMSYDLILIKQFFQCFPAKVFDTQIGARLLGVKSFGLAGVLKFFLNIDLDKSSQLADWSQRPLTMEMKCYALKDVEHLLELAEVILERLENLGRRQWFEQSCLWEFEKVLNRSAVKQNPWLVKGAEKFSARQLLFFKKLWFWRDQEARDKDLPPFKISPNWRLLEWSQQLGNGKNISIPKRYSSRRVTTLRETVKEAKLIKSKDYSNPWIDRPKKRILTDIQQNRLDQLIKLRDQQADSLDLEGAVIASNKLLRRFVLDENQLEKYLMDWQRELLGLSE